MPRFLLAVLALLVAFPSAAQDTLSVVVRVDDVHSRSSIDPRGLGSLEATVEARGGRVSWVVIPHRLIEPQNASGVLASELTASAARGHEIVLHGYTHICTRCGQSGHEMWCARDVVAHSESHQRELVTDGLALLGTHLGTPTVQASVPPGHYGDKTTFRLMAERGITTVSVPARYEDSLATGQFNLRTSEDFAWALTEGTYAAMRTATLDDVRTRGMEQGYYVLLLHDPFTRPGYRDDLVATWTGEVMDSIAVMTDGRVRFETMTASARRVQTRTTATAPVAQPAALPARLWPTVSTGTAQLRVSEAVRLTLVDVLGRPVWQRTLDASSAPHTLDAGPVPSGFYLLVVEGNPSRTALPWHIVR